MMGCLSMRIEPARQACTELPPSGRTGGMVQQVERRVSLFREESRAEIPVRKVEET